MKLASTCILAVVAAGLFAGSAPKPSEIPTTWQLEFQQQPLVALRVHLVGRAKPQLFWYMRYRVTNRTGADRMFVPEFIMYTDTGQMVRAGRNVPPAVFEKIERIHNDPLLKDMAGMAGKLLQGEDNAKDGVAIWSDFDPKSGAVDVLIGGLSGETVEIKLPKPIPVKQTDITGKTSTKMKDTVILSKTLMLRYSVPGEAAARGQTTPKLLSQSWVMR